MARIPPPTHAAGEKSSGCDNKLTEPKQPERTDNKLASTFNTNAEHATPIDRMAADAEQAGCVADPMAERLVCASVYMASTPPPRDPVIAGLIDLCDKLAMFGKSKSYKTWLLMQFGGAVAEGRPFIGFEVPVARRVLFVNPEVRPHHMHRRLRMFAGAAGCDCLDNLFFLHTRGTGASWPDITEAALRVEAEVVLVDSIYKFQSGTENESDAWKELCFQMDVLCETTGALLAYSHHDTKGTTADKAVVDRGSGSGVAGRDYDACIALSAHRELPETVVAEFVARNYAAPDTRSLTWRGGCFEVAADASNVIATSHSRMQAMTRTPPLEKYYQRVIDSVEGGLIPRGILEERVKAATGLGRNRILTLINNALHEGLIARTGRIKERNGTVLYGTPTEVGLTENQTNQKNGGAE